jgi:hypothetical protein
MNDVLESMQGQDHLPVESRRQTAVFLDEINTCNSMGLFKEMLCDRTMNGRPLPGNLNIVAACNPYRLRKGLMKTHGRETGLAFDTFHAKGEDSDAGAVGSGIHDPLADLVYRVHPLPESMIDQVFDFGSLSVETERLYIKAKISNMLSPYKDRAVLAQTEELLRAQEGIGDAKVFVRGDRLVAYVMPQDEDVDGLKAAMGQFGTVKEEPTSRLLQPQHKPPGYVEPEAANMGLFGALPPYLVPAVIVGMNTFPRHTQDGPNKGEVDSKDKKFQEAPEGGWATPFGEFVEVFTGLICAAQEYVRDLSEGERCAASLRDVQRCMKVYDWFGSHFADVAGEEVTKHEFLSVQPNAQRHINSAIVLSLAFCYQARLPRAERAGLRERLVAERGVSQGAAYVRFTPGSFVDTVEAAQKTFVSEMNLGEGIALNEALCENLFMILVSVLNEVPLFLIGKPGSSKSLAMRLLQENLNGKDSENDFLRNLPAIEVFSYQCSPLSTSQGIEAIVELARRFKRSAVNTVVVVLLDEVGLAEQSPHLPLKVLHKVFDTAEAGESVVGISNWSLDPAKMNRAVHLFRPAPTARDLAITAEGMVSNAQVKGTLRNLAGAYNEVYQAQQEEAEKNKGKHSDFWGLREFYATVKFISSALKADDAELTPALVLDAVLRNFGGIQSKLGGVLSVFFRHLGLEEVSHAARMADPHYGVVELVRRNCVDREARHLMTLTKNNAALPMLFDEGVLAHENTEVRRPSRRPSHSHAAMPH